MQNSPYYTLGLDLGKRHDPAALALVEDDRYVDQLRVRGLHRFQLGTAYRDLVAALRPRLSHPPLANRVRIAIDATGVGDAIVELFQEQLPEIVLYAITITGGGKVTGGTRDPRVPKPDLIAATIVAFEQRDIRIAAEMEATPTLVDELLSFKRSSTEHGHTTYGAESAQHDDLVLALSLAIWLIDNRPSPDPNLPTVSWDRGEIEGIVPMGAGILY
jgi:hypothetical protein